MATRFMMRWRPLLLVALAVAVGVTFAVSRAGSAAAASAPRLTAIEIADGVLFNDGRAADYLTSLRRGPMTWTDEARETQSRINRSIEANPKWANAFTTQMQSGDPRQVAQGLSDLGVIVRRELDQQYGPEKIDEIVLQIDKEWIEEKMVKGAILDGEFSFGGSGTWLDTDTVVATYVAVAAAIAVVMAVVAVVFTPKEFSDRANLASEILVQHFAAGLQLRV